MLHRVPIRARTSARHFDNENAKLRIHLHAVEPCVRPRTNRTVAHGPLTWLCFTQAFHPVRIAMTQSTLPNSCLTLPTNAQRDTSAADLSAGERRVLLEYGTEAVFGA